MQLLRGNSKITDDSTPYLVRKTTRLPGPAGTCTAASAACWGTDGRPRCYAARLANLRPNVAKSWAKVTEFASADPAGFRALLFAEIAAEAARAAALGKTAVVRFHESGDFDSAEYIETWILAARAFRNVRFFGFTRAWADPVLRPFLSDLEREPNVYLWASADPTMPEPPAGWRVARMIPRAAEKVGIRCLEESGRKGSCAECTLCFSARPSTAIHFVER